MSRLTWEIGHTRRDERNDPVNHADGPMMHIVSCKVDKQLDMLLRHKHVVRVLHPFQQSRRGQKVVHIPIYRAARTIKQSKCLGKYTTLLQAPSHPAARKAELKSASELRV